VAVGIRVAVGCKAGVGGAVGIGVTDGDVVGVGGAVETGVAGDAGVAVGAQVGIAVAVGISVGGGVAGAVVITSCGGMFDGKAGVGVGVTPLQATRTRLLRAWFTHVARAYGRVIVEQRHRYFGHC
jgi:hypothetical protein